MRTPLKARGQADRAQKKNSGADIAVLEFFYAVKGEWYRSL